MKQIVLIVLFCVSRVFAQVAAPDLRCIEVLADKSTKLTWIPPADPSNQFSSYEVYYSVFKNGPYTSLNANITSITTNTFIHTFASNVQNRYYFMLSRFKIGGVSDSTRSDTIRNIFLNLVSGIKTLDVSYNGIHNPKLPTTAVTFTVLKESPPNTWKTLYLGSNTLYPDTIDVCHDTLNYRVFLYDASGCVSTSNLQGGFYHDSKEPEEPYVDSISVLPNGKTCLAWQIPVDRDIVYYRLFYKTSGLNQQLDSVPGRSTRFYTFNSFAADSQAIGLFVAAGDSCGRQGTPYYNQKTIFLRADYDQCAYRSVLRWNSYRWYSAPNKFKHSTKEYRIYYSTDGVNYSRIDATTDTMYVHENVAPGKNISYFVRVVNVGETVTSSSNRAHFISGQTGSSSFIYLSSASVIDKTSSEIRILLDSSVAIKGIDVQRADRDTNFSSIGFIPHHGGKFYSFTDKNADTQKKSYSYRVIVRDSCDNPRGSSNVAKTILLKVHESETDFYLKQLRWSAYSGFAGRVSGYEIYRVINDVLDPSPFAITDSLTLTFTDNLESVSSKGAKIDYRIKAIEGFGNPYGIYENSFSNPYPVYMDGGLFIPNAFAPKGINTVWLPVTYFVEKTEYHVSVFNRWGKKVFETSSDSKGWDGSDCLPDVYVYLIDYKNSRGEYIQIKGHVTLIH